MKARLLALASSVLFVSLMGCNGVGPKETLLAKINDESIYKEDILYMLDGGRYDRDTLPLGKMLYDRYYSAAALTSRAKEEYPELEEEWKSLSASLEIRWLTSLYQKSYLGECMGFSDEELRKYYEDHREDYPKADSISGYYGVRHSVAGDYFVFKNKELYETFLKQDLALIKNPTQSDSALSRRKFLNDRTKNLQESANANILENHHYKIVELPAIDPKAYYEKHKDMYKTVPGYVLYHVQGSDSLRLATDVPETVDLESFKKLAVKRSSNKQTAVDSGLVGFVKIGYALPYGIGVLPSLDSILEGKLAGFVTPVLQSPNKAYHKFYLASLVPAALKPYDRAEPAIRKSIENDELLDVDSSTVLITKDGKPVLTEAGLLEFNEKFMKRAFTKRSHDWAVKMLAEHYAFADAAKAVRLDHEWEYRALVRSARYEFYVDRYMNKVLASVSEDSARAWFDKMYAADNPMTKFEEVKERMMLMAAFPSIIVKRDYYMGYALMYAGRSYENTVLELFDRRYGSYRSAMKERLMAEAYNSARVHFYDSSIPEFKPTSYAQAIIARADSLYKAGNKDDAYMQYRTLFYAYAGVDSLACKAMYAMPDIRNDQGRYAEAEAEYYSFYKSCPQDSNAEKAMFSRGFILNENMNQDSLALEVLGEFVNRYPHSEFNESANWLMDNIRSGGKLQEELTRKIEENP